MKKIILYVIALLVLCMVVVAADDIWNAQIQENEAGNANSGFSGNSRRYLINNAYTNKSITAFQVVVKGWDGSAGLKITSASICVQDATAGCVDAPVRITWDSGNIAMTGSAQEAGYTSDCIEFSMDNDTNYLMSWDANSATADDPWDFSNGGGGTEWYKAGDAVMNQSADGWNNNGARTCGYWRIIDCGAAADTTPPAIDISTYNHSTAVDATNETVWRTSFSTPSWTKDSTPTVRFDTDEAANCSISKTDANFTAMVTANNESECSTNDVAGVTSHVCTLPYDLRLTGGHENIYLACIDMTGNENATSSSTGLRTNFVPDPAVLSRAEYAINGTYGTVSAFNSSFIKEIELMYLNFSVGVEYGNIVGYYLNFTANGSSACALGNKQESTCYRWTPLSYVQYISGEDTATYDGTLTGGNQGDQILPTTSGLGTGNLTLSFSIDEHYSPNVFKHYGADFDFSDVKWQTGTDQRITKNNMIRINITNSNIPNDADIYRFDMRLNYTTGLKLPDQPLLVWMCNLSYGGGHPDLTANCSLGCSYDVADFQDDGTQMRCVFTKNSINNLNNAGYIVLEHNEVDVTKYFYMKTYKADAAGWRTNWDYSVDDGDTFTNLGDGYETEANINYWYDGTNDTSFVYNLYVNTSINTSTTFLGEVLWDINPNQNYPPILNVVYPDNGDTVTLPDYINFTVTDPNNNEVNTTIFINDTVLVTNLNASNTSYYWDEIKSGVQHVLHLQGCELETAELYCENVTRTFDLADSWPPQLITFEGNSTGEGNLSQLWIYASINATDETEFSTLNVTLWNTSLVSSTQCSSVSCSINFTSLGEGTYYVNGTGVDASGNENQSVTRTILLDVTGPTPSYESGTTATGNYSQTTISMNVSCAVADSDTITLYIYNSSLVNGSFTCKNSSCYSTFYDLADGSYHINATCNDSANNLGITATRDINLDNVGPTVYVNSTNASNMPQTITYHFSVVDDLPANCTVYNNITGTWAFNESDTEITSGTLQTLQVTHLQDVNNLTFDWSVRCFDDVGNSAMSSSNYTYYFDGVIPRSLVIYPTSGVSNESLTFDLLHTENDTNLESCFYSVKTTGGTLDISNTSINCSINETFTVSAYAGYNLFYFVNDTHGNVNETVVAFTATAPAVTGGGGGGGGFFISDLVLDKFIISPGKLNFKVPFNGTAEKIIRFENLQDMEVLSVVVSSGLDVNTSFFEARPLGTTQILLTVQGDTVGTFDDVIRFNVVDSRSATYDVEVEVTYEVVTGFEALFIDWVSKVGLEGVWNTLDSVFGNLTFIVVLVVLLGFVPLVMWVRGRKR